MTIKWYWPAERLGLVKNISHEYNDGGTYWSVAGNTGDVFLTLIRHYGPIGTGSGNVLCVLKFKVNCLHRVFAQKVRCFFVMATAICIGYRNRSWN